MIKEIKSLSFSPILLAMMTVSVLIDSQKTIQAAPPSSEDVANIASSEKKDNKQQISLKSRQISLNKTNKINKSDKEQIQTKQISLQPNTTNQQAIKLEEKTQTILNSSAIAIAETLKQKKIDLNPSAEREVKLEEKNQTILNSSAIAIAETLKEQKISLNSQNIDLNIQLSSAQKTQLLTQTEIPETPPENNQPDKDTVNPEAEDSAEPRVLVAEVVVEGAEGELQDLVYQTINTRPGRTTTRSQLQADVNAVYATGFFSDVRVTPEDTPLGVRITFSVQPNPTLSKVQVETVPPGEGKQVVPPEVIDEIFQEQYGKILNLQDLKQGIQKLNTWYKEQGYDLAQVVGAPRVSPDGTVTLLIAEGIIEDIKVRYFDDENEPKEGNTKEYIITREIELKPGDVFNRKTAQKDLQRVFGLNIFEDVKFSFEPGSDPSKVIVNVDVTEGSTGSLAAGAGFSSASGFFGTVSYQQKNLGGNNQTLGAEFQLGTRALLFDVNFRDPWIAGDPYRTSYSINAFRRRSISLVFDGDDEDIRTADGDDNPRVVRTGGGITFGRPIADTVFSKPDWRLSAGFEYQHVAIQNADGDISPRSREEDGNELLSFSESGEDDLFLLKFGASSDKRDNALQPTSGSFLRLGVDQSLPFGSGSILLTRLRGSYSYYIPVSYLDIAEGPQALAFNIQAGTVIGDLPPYEAFVLGGSNSVRGYAEGEVGSGRTFLQATAEYRFPLFSFLSGALFVDYGTTLGSDGDVPGEPSKVRDLPGDGFGYGLGVRIQSPLGPIRVDYAINDEGDSRIHFGIGERF